MTIFVGGVHAVGKTYVLGPACQQLGVRHASASQLIKEQRGLQSWTATRQVRDIDDNQRALVDAVKRIEGEGQRLVLDGHFVLRRSVNDHERIDPQTYMHLGVSGLILFEARIETILDRLHRRGDHSWDMPELSAFAHSELTHAQTVASQLGLELVVLSMPSVSQVCDAIGRFWPPSTA